jgi:hypothetical protein
MPASGLGVNGSGGAAAILTEPYSATKKSTPIPLPTSIRHDLGVGIGIGIEESALGIAQFATCFLSSLENQGSNAMNHIQL